MGLFDLSRTQGTELDRDAPASLLGCRALPRWLAHWIRSVLRLVLHGCHRGELSSAGVRRPRQVLPRVADEIPGTRLGCQGDIFLGVHRYSGFHVYQVFHSALEGLFARLEGGHGCVSIDHVRIFGDELVLQRAPNLLDKAVARWIV